MGMHNKVWLAVMHETDRFDGKVRPMSLASSVC